MHKNKGIYGKRDDQALKTTNLLWGHSGEENMRDDVDDIGDDDDDNGDHDDDDEAEECER